jgi:hypothetical protein
MCTTLANTGITSNKPGRNKPVNFELLIRNLIATYSFIERNGYGMEYKWFGYSEWHFRRAGY